MGSYACDITDCQYVTDNREKFAGHRSVHVRRGDIPKRAPKQKRDHQCDVCDRRFTTGMGLGAHKKMHRIDFSELKTHASRGRRLLIENGRQCSNCKLTEWMGNPIPLDVDHVDGNSDNDKRINLRLLCPNCHRLTPTWGMRNKGKHVSHRSALMKARRNSKSSCNSEARVPS